MAVSLEPSAKRLPADNPIVTPSSLPHELYVEAFKYLFCSQYDIEYSELNLRLVNKQWSVIITADILPYLWTGLSREEGLIDYSVMIKDVPETASLIIRFRMLWKRIIQENQLSPWKGATVPVSKSWLSHLCFEIRINLDEAANALQDAYGSMENAQLLEQAITSVKPLPIYLRGDEPANVCFWQAILYKVINRHSAAIEMFDKCLNRKPDNPSIIGKQYYERVDSLRRLGQDFIHALNKGIEAYALCSDDELECDNLEEKAWMYEMLGRHLTDPLAARDNLDKAALTYLSLTKSELDNAKRFEERFPEAKDECVKSANKYVSHANRCHPSGNLLARLRLYSGDICAFRKEKVKAIEHYQAGLVECQDDSNLRDKLYLSYTSLL